MHILLLLVLLLQLAGLIHAAPAGTRNGGGSGGNKGGGGGGKGGGGGGGGKGGGGGDTKPKTTVKTSTLATAKPYSVNLLSTPKGGGGSGGGTKGGITTSLLSIKPKEKTQTGKTGLPDNLSKKFSVSTSTKTPSDTTKLTTLKSDDSKLSKLSLGGSKLQLTTTKLGDDTKKGVTGYVKPTTSIKEATYITVKPYGVQPKPKSTDRASVRARTDKNYLGSIARSADAAANTASKTRTLFDQIKADSLSGKLGKGTDYAQKTYGTTFDYLRQQSDKAIYDQQRNAALLPYLMQQNSKATDSIQTFKSTYKELGKNIGAERDALDKVRGAKTNAQIILALRDVLKSADADASLTKKASDIIKSLQPGAPAG